MKRLIELLPTVLITAIIVYAVLVFFKQEPEPLPPDQEKISKLEAKIKQSEKEISELKVIRDSLLESNNQIEYVIINQIADIDSSIAVDSSNAISKYKFSLSLHNYLPDAVDILTFREIGIGAKIITEASGLKLKINNYESALEIEKNINKKYADEITSLNEISTIKTTAIDYWEDRYNKTQSFWYDRFIIYAGAGINYNGTNLAPGIQAGIGIRITSIKF